MGIRASHSPWDTDKQSWGSSWVHLPGEWVWYLLRPCSSSGIWTRLICHYANWLRCTRAPLWDFKIFLSGALTEGNMKLFRFFAKCIFHEKNIINIPLLLQAGFQVSAWMLEAGAAGAPLHWGRTHWCRAQGEGACAAVDPLAGKWAKLRQCVFLHAQLHIHPYLGRKAAHFLP